MLLETDDRSLRIRVFNAIENAILDGEYKDGDSLNELRLSKELGVSRSTLFRRLKECGYRSELVQAAQPSASKKEGFLICLIYLVAFVEMSYQQRGIPVMEKIVLPGLIRIGVRIAVSASVRTGAVPSDIPALHAMAPFPPTLVLQILELNTIGLTQGFQRDACLA